jgi:hypothetical protein
MVAPASLAVTGPYPIANCHRWKEVWAAIPPLIEGDGSAARFCGCGMKARMGGRLYVGKNQAARGASLLSDGQYGCLAAVIRLCSSEANSPGKQARRTFFISIKPVILISLSTLQSNKGIGRDPFHGQHCPAGIRFEKSSLCLRLSFILCDANLRPSESDCNRLCTFLWL